MVMPSMADLTISIHAPRKGGDITKLFINIEGLDFNPRPPQGGRRYTWYTWYILYRFQSTPPARGATNKYGKLSRIIVISIHAPRKGGDHFFVLCQRVKNNFNPRPPQGGRHHVEAVKDAETGISIHAPRKGGDSKDAQFYLRIFDK